MIQPKVYQSSLEGIPWVVIPSEPCVLLHVYSSKFREGEEQGGRCLKALGRLKIDRYRDYYYKRVF